MVDGSGEVLLTVIHGFKNQLPENNVRKPIAFERDERKISSYVQVLFLLQTAIAEITC